MTAADPFDAALDALARHPALRAVNVHHTPHTRADELARQLERVAAGFTTLNEAGLATFAASGRWAGPRPPLVLGFFNGLRDNVDVALPILQRLDLKAWFFVPTGFVLTPPGTQADFAAANRIALRPGDYADGRHALSPGEIRMLAAEGHAIAAHTRNHRMAAEGDAAALRDEIVGAQDDMRLILGRPVSAFAFQSGAALGENEAADALLRQAGYRFLFSNLRIQPIR